MLETKLLKLQQLQRQQLISWQAAANLFVDALATTDPTPGGGSAAGVNGAMGCALGQMAIGITLRGKKLEEAKRPALRSLLESLGGHKAALQGCVAEDAASFDGFMEAMKIPKDNPERKVKMQAALKHAAEVPLKTARLASEALAGLGVCGGSISNHVASDYRSARYQLETAIRCAAENVFINAEGLEDKAYAEKITAEIKGYLSCCEAMQVPYQRAMPL